VEIFDNVMVAVSSSQDLYGVFKLGVQLTQNSVLTVMEYDPKYFKQHSQMGNKSHPVLVTLDQIINLQMDRGSCILGFQAQVRFLPDNSPAPFRLREWVNVKVEWPRLSGSAIITLWK
jgi:hypothetical protein